MSQFWSDTVQRLTPYVPGEQPKISGLIKLNTNECPYGPSPKVLAAMREAINDQLRLYPDPNADSLRKAIASFFNKRYDAELTSAHVFVGSGSDEVLAHTFHGLLNHPQPLLFPDISYSFYPVYCNLYNIANRAIPLDSDYSIDLSAFQQPNGGIVIANPNAPTGELIGLAAIDAMVSNNPNAVVVIDEAYIDFGGDSAAPLIKKHANLLVVQTLSKSRSLAGLRVGFALGQPHLIEGLQRVKNSFNSYPLSCLAINGAVAALEDSDYFDEICRKVIASREQLAKHLENLGFIVLPSAANFLFVSHPDKSAADIAAELRQRKILVRHFVSPRIDNHLRISIGNEQECQALVDALTDILA